MKKLFYYAFALLVTIGMAACSSDDNEEEVKVYTPNLSTPANATGAVQYTLATALPGSSDDAPRLKTIDITESSELLLELNEPATGKAVFVKEKATISGNTYTVNTTNVQGTVKVKGTQARSTRADASTELEINLTISFAGAEAVTYVTEEGQAVAATVNTPVSTDEALNNLARTWKIIGAIVDLKGDDIKAYEEFDSRNGMFYLEDVLKEAIDQGVSLTEREQQDFKKVIKSITVTKTGIFTIDYADGTEDAAQWSWTNAEKNQFSIKLKDADMGNKFVADDSRGSVAYNQKRCNLKLQTTVTDNKNKKWTVALTLKLEE